jgi:tetratricopeptide (TPR) repeat protein
LAGVCLVLFASHALVWAQESAYQKGVNAFLAGNFEKAIKELLLSLTENPENFDSYYYLGMSYLSLNKTDDAYFTFKRSLDLRVKRDHLVPEVYAAMMRIQIAKYNYPAAEKLGLYALRTGYKSTTLFFELARAYLFKKEFSKSQKAIDLALELDPVNPYAYNLQALLFLSRGMPNHAVTAAQTAIAFKEDVPYFYSSLGAAYEQLTQYDKALHAYQKALKLAPLDVGYQQSVARLQTLLKKAPK